MEKSLYWSRVTQLTSGRAETRIHATIVPLLSPLLLLLTLFSSIEFGTATFIYKICHFDSQLCHVFLRNETIKLASKHDVNLNA